MATSNVNVKGMKELAEALNGLPDRIQANVLRSALRAGAKLIQQEAIQQVPVDSGDLRASIKVGTRSSRGIVQATIKAGGKTAWYAKFIEFGTAAHTITAKDGGFLSFGGHQYRSVSHPGIQARPFMRPALDGRAQAAIQAVADAMRKRLADKHGINVPVPMEEGDE